MMYVFSQQYDIQPCYLMSPCSPQNSSTKLYLDNCFLTCNCMFYYSFKEYFERVLPELNPIYTDCFSKFSI